MSPYAPSQNSIVLVVEDEAFIREDVIDVLERDGFSVLRAANVQEALAVLNQHSGIRAVLISGEVVAREGAVVTQERRGRVLRR